MRVLLINLPFYRLMRVRHCYFPVGLGYVAAAARQAGFTVRLYDMEKDARQQRFATNLLLANRIAGHAAFMRALDDAGHPVWAELRQTLAAEQPQVVGISIWTTVYPVAQKVAALIKALLPQAVIVAGGIHATVCDTEVLADTSFDFVVRGEGEETFAALLRCLRDNPAAVADVAGVTYRHAGRLCRAPARSLRPVLDTLPLPARDAVLYPDRFTGRDWGCLVSARGCPFHCSFCGSHALWGRQVRARSIAAVCAEMQSLYEDKGVTFFTLFDDTFTLEQERVRRWCEYIAGRRLPVRWFAHGRVDTVDAPMAALLRRGGCYAMQFGVESGRQNRLDALHKGVRVEQSFAVRQLFRTHRLIFWATMLIGTPGETEEDLRGTYAMLAQLQPDLVNVNAFVPYPGAQDWRQIYNRAPRDWRCYAPQSRLTNFSGMPDKTWHYWRDRIERRADKLNRRTLRSWRWWWRRRAP